MADHLTTRELAEFLGVDEWRVRRLFETKSVPEPPRFGGKRAIPRSQIPAIVHALEGRGWLPVPTAPAEPVNAG
jgi:hypothetical protein